MQALYNPVTSNNVKTLGIPFHSIRAAFNVVALHPYRVKSKPRS